MTIYIVKQYLVSERKVMVEASSKSEAIEKAQDGYYEEVIDQTPQRLLASEAEKS